MIKKIKANSHDSIGSNNLHRVNLWKLHLSTGFRYWKSEYSYLSDASFKKTSKNIIGCRI